MASPSSWMQSFMSPANKWFASESMRALTKRLRLYGLALGSVLTGMKVKEQSRTSLLEEEEANRVRIESVRDIGEVEEIIGYKFKNQMLLLQAFTHVSYQDKCDYKNKFMSYERLEYVGDSVLNLLITKEQFFKYQNLPPGSLTPLRAANVDTEKLARVAVKNNFHKYLRHGKPVLSKQIRVFINTLPNYPLHSHGLIDAPKVLADIVESTIGAIFIDSNSSVDTTWQVAKGLLEPIITPDMLQTNPVKKLFEMCQKHRLKVKFKDLWLQEGAYEIFVNNQLRGRGEYAAKKEIALNRAADAAYNKIVRSLDVKEAVNNGY